MTIRFHKVNIYTSVHYIHDNNTASRCDLIWDTVLTAAHRKASLSFSTTLSRVLTAQRGRLNNAAANIEQV